MDFLNLPLIWLWYLGNYVVFPYIQCHTCCKALLYKGNRTFNNFSLFSTFTGISLQPQALILFNWLTAFLTSSFVISLFWDLSFSPCGFVIWILSGLLQLDTLGLSSDSKTDSHLYKTEVVSLATEPSSITVFTFTNVSYMPPKFILIIKGYFFQLEFLLLPKYFF